MSEEEEPEAEGVPLSGVIHAQSSMAVHSFLASGSATGDQSFEYADVQIRVEDAAHQRRVEQQRIDHELQEATRDNFARRSRESRDDAARRKRENFTFYTCIGVPVAGLIFGAALSIWTTDETTKLFAHNLISLIFGGILGGLAGYFTDKGQ